MKPGDPAFVEATTTAHRKRLIAQGLKPEVADILLGQYGDALFKPKTLIVVAHLSREAIEEVELLDVFPSARKIVRTAVVVSHGIDPRLQDRARVLIKQLGDPAYQKREGAEALLFELGAVAVPVLEDALKEKDVEIVYRAERVLMRLNRPIP